MFDTITAQVTDCYIKVVTNVTNVTMLLHQELAHVAQRYDHVKFEATACLMAHCFVENSQQRRQRDKLIRAVEFQIICSILWNHPLEVR